MPVAEDPWSTDPRAPDSDEFAYVDWVCRRAAALQPGEVREDTAPEDGAFLGGEGDPERPGERRFLCKGGVRLRVAAGNGLLQELEFGLALDDGWIPDWADGVLDLAGWWALGLGFRLRERGFNPLRAEIQNQPLAPGLPLDAAMSVCLSRLQLGGSHCFRLLFLSFRQLCWLRCGAICFRIAPSCGVSGGVDFGLRIFCRLCFSSACPSEYRLVVVWFSHVCNPCWPAIPPSRIVARILCVCSLPFLRPPSVDLMFAIPSSPPP